MSSVTYTVATVDKVSADEFKLTHSGYSVFTDYLLAWRHAGICRRAMPSKIFVVVELKNVAPPRS